MPAAYGSYGAQCYVSGKAFALVFRQYQWRAKVDGIIFHARERRGCLKRAASFVFFEGRDIHMYVENKRLREATLCHIEYVYVFEYVCSKISL